jgi:hypothetical protein
VAVAAGKQWCAANGSVELEVDGQGPLSADHVDAVTSASDNSSYSAIRVTTDNLGIFANTTGGCDMVAGSDSRHNTQHALLQMLCERRVVFVAHGPSGSDFRGEALSGNAVVSIAGVVADHHAAHCALSACKSRLTILHELVIALHASLPRH